MNVQIPALRLVNVGTSTADLEQAEQALLSLPGIRVEGRGDASGVPYLQASIGETLANLFEQPIYSDEPIARGWSHLSFVTNDLDYFLNDPRWSGHLIREPWRITTLEDERKLAFFEPLPGCRIELMQISQSLPLHGSVPGASTIYEAQGRRGESTGLIHRAGESSMLGRALTVECQIGDNLAVHRAVASAEPGDVLVISGRNARVGYVGDVLVQAAKARKVAGIVVDGGVRDIDELRTIGLPVWSTQVAMTGATKLTPGRLREDVAFAGTIVNQGAIVRADSDGVVFVPSSHWPKVLEAARERDASEDLVAKRLCGGETTMEIFGLDGV